MDRLWVKYAVSIIMIISLIIVGISTIMMDDNRNANFLGHSVIFIHHIFGIIFLILIFAHVIMHLDWIWAMTKRIFVKEN